MQQRMKTHSLTKEQIEGLLLKGQVGRIATQDPEGYPYVVLFISSMIMGRYILMDCQKGSFE